MTTYTKRTYLNDMKPVDVVAVDFAMRDSKGRALGHRGKIYAERFDVLTDEEADGDFYYSRHTVEPGEYFSVAPQATRAGCSFGATQLTRRFRTLDEARAFVRTQAEKSRKRYAKMGA